VTETVTTVPHPALDTHPCPVCQQGAIPAQRYCDECGAALPAAALRRRWTRPTVRLVLLALLGWTIVALLVAGLIWSFSSVQDTTVLGPLYEAGEYHGQPISWQVRHQRVFPWGRWDVLESGSTQAEPAAAAAQGRFWLALGSPAVMPTDPASCLVLLYGRYHEQRDDQAAETGAGDTQYRRQVEDTWSILFGLVQWQRAWRQEARYAGPAGDARRILATHADLLTPWPAHLATVQVQVAGRVVYAGTGDALQRLIELVVQQIAGGAGPLGRFNLANVFPTLLAGLWTAVLVLVSVVDWRYQVIPNLVVWPALGLAILVAPLHPQGFNNALAGGLASGGLFLGLYGLGRLLRHPALFVGLGDVELGAFIGLILGWQSVVGALLVGHLLALAAGIVLLLRYRRRTVPLGPFLTLGALWWLWQPLGCLP